MASRARILIMIVILAALGTATWMRAMPYSDEATLWGDAALKSPGKARVHNNYGFGLKEKFRLREARREFEKAIELDPEFAEAYNNLATVCSLMGDEKNAIRYFRKTLSLDEGNTEARYNLAMHYYETGRIGDAAREFRLIVRIRPFSAAAELSRSMLEMIRNRQASGVRR